MRREGQFLLAKGRASLRAAKLLNEQGYADFAISRAYYAMFYAAEALLLEHGLHFSSHAGVIAAFGREFAKTGVLDPKFHRYLLDAQDLRNLADYGIGQPVQATQVEEALRWAAEFLAEAERVLAAPSL